MVEVRLGTIDMIQATKGILAQAANFYDDDGEEDSSDDSSSSSDSDDSDSGDKKKKKKKNSKASKKRGPVNQGPEFLDDDHRLLLRCTRPCFNRKTPASSWRWRLYILPGADSGRSKSDASVGVRGENKTGVSTRVVEKCRGDGGGVQPRSLPFAL